VKRILSFDSANTVVHDHGIVVFGWQFREQRDLRIHFWHSVFSTSSQTIRILGRLTWRVFWKGFPTTRLPWSCGVEYKKAQDDPNSNIGIFIDRFIEKVGSSSIFETDLLQKLSPHNVPIRTAAADDGPLAPAG
jgi:hypothetical protein